MITAQTIMSENPITIKETATAAQAAQLMIKKHVGTLLVTKNSMPIATIGRKELVAAANKANAKSTKVKDVMSKDFFIVENDAPFSYIARKMRRNNIKRCPVVNNNELVGIITETDVLNTYRDFTRSQQVQQDATLVAFGIVTALFLFLFSPMGQRLLGL